VQGELISACEEGLTRGGHGLLLDGVLDIDARTIMVGYCALIFACKEGLTEIRL
jgi:hypothetical protein